MKNSISIDAVSPSSPHKKHLGPGTDAAAENPRPFFGPSRRYLEHDSELALIYDA